MTATDHSLLSSYREALLEHLFAGEVMKHVWLSGTKRLEVLKPQVDDGGYDLVLEAGSVVRHIQLKATFKGSKVRRFNILPGGARVGVEADHAVARARFAEERLGPVHGRADRVRHEDFLPGMSMPTCSR